MAMEKHMQRKEIRNRMKNLDPCYCQTADKVIQQYIFSLPEYRKASFLFCYVSIGQEVDTRSLMEEAWQSGKRIAVPKCLPGGRMDLLEIHSFQDLEAGAFGIPEPKAFCSPASLSQIEFALIPCLSCDRGGNRLGHGGGYYDRCLAGASFPTAALCRERLLLEQIYCEPHDRPVSMVISEKGIFKNKRISPA